MLIAIRLSQNIANTNNLGDRTRCSIFTLVFSEANVRYILGIGLANIEE